MSLAVASLSYAGCSWTCVTVTRVPLPSPSVCVPPSTSIVAADSSTVQCAAVSTHRGAISVPPQNWACQVSAVPCWSSATSDGHVPAAGA